MIFSCAPESSATTTSVRLRRGSLRIRRVLEDSTRATNEVRSPATSSVSAWIRPRWM